MPAGGDPTSNPNYNWGNSPLDLGNTAYEDVVRKVRNNKVSPDDFAGVTMTLTNPGTLGTVSSVPRLMPGQSVIVWAPQSV